MLFVYSYCLGARRQQLMPFRPPFLAAGERFVENKMSCRIRLISLLFYRFIQNPAWELSANPCGWPPTHQIGVIDWIDAIGVANGAPWWWCLWGELCCCSTDYSYYSYCRKSTGWDFLFPPKPIVVKLLTNQFNSISREDFLMSFPHLFPNSPPSQPYSMMRKPLLLLFTTKGMTDLANGVSQVRLPDIVPNQVAKHHLPALIYGFSGEKTSSFIFGRNIACLKIL